ncbi:MAG TPA: glycosyltransferase family 87 protein [Terriglobales bacterium]|nr:glycosyltransferase family 87 protein [Terriglobales bacterium]
MVRTGAGRQLYDYPAQLRFQNHLVSREDLALPFVRPAYAALLFAPLSRLSFKSAYLVFLAINVCLLVLCWVLFRGRTRSLAKIYKWLPAALFLAYLPVAAALLQGQDSILLLTLFVIAAILLDRGRDMTAGLVVGAGLFKLQVVLPIAALFLLWRRWRFSCGFLLSSLAAGMASIWVIGQNAAWGYVRSLFIPTGSSQLPNVLHSYPLDPQVMPNLHGLIYGLLAGRIPSPWLFALVGLLSCALLIFSAVRGSGLRGAEPLYLAITTSVLVSYYLLIHDLSVLLLPVLVSLDRFIGAESSGDRRGRMIVRASMVAFVAPICTSYAPSLFYLVCLPVLGLLLAQAAAYRDDLTWECSNSVLAATPQASQAD